MNSINAFQLFSWIYSLTYHILWLTYTEHFKNYNVHWCEKGKDSNTLCLLFLAFFYLCTFSQHNIKNYPGQCYEIKQWQLIHGLTTLTFPTLIQNSDIKVLIYTRLFSSNKWYTKFYIKLKVLPAQLEISTTCYEIPMEHFIL